jgi:hypothetical protein
MQEDGFSLKVLHFQKCKTSKQIHQTLQTKDMYGNAKKGMDNIFLYKKFMSRNLFQMIFLTHRHLLIIYGHGSHVTLKSIECA